MSRTQVRILSPANLSSSKMDIRKKWLKWLEVNECTRDFLGCLEEDVFKFWKEVIDKLNKD